MGAVTSKIEYLTMPAAYTLPVRRLPRKDFEGQAVLGKNGEPLEGRLTPRYRQIYALINSFSPNEEHPERRCLLTYDETEELFGMSPATFARGLATLKDELIECETGEHGERRYKSKVQPIKLDSMIVFPSWYKAGGITVKEKFYKFAPTQLETFFFMVSHCKRELDDYVFRGSEVHIANIIGCAESTASLAIRGMMKKRIIFRKYTARNAHEETVYIIDRKFVRHYLKTKAEVFKKDETSESDAKRPAEQPAKVKKVDYRTEAEIAADERGARERIYAIRHQEAAYAADRRRKKANEDEDFRQAHAAVRALEIELAKAELYNPEKVAAIEAEMERAEKARAFALQRLGLSMDDLEERHVCSKCSDTGFLPDGRMCDCDRRSPERRGRRS